MFSRLAKSKEFMPIPQTEDGECDNTISIPPPSNKGAFLILGVVFLATFILAGTLGLWVGSWMFSTKTKNFALSDISVYSPMSPDVDITFQTVRFNGSLMKENIFRQDAGPETDAAWESLGTDYRAAIVPAELAERSGLTPDQVQVSEKYGGGFPANVEGMHHLHCLNLLRKSLYYNYDHYYALKKGPFSNPDEVIRVHVSHCLDIIRQQLMCTVDVAVLGQVWVDKEQPFAYVDFNTKHTCRNFEDVRRWAEVHQAPLEVPDDFLKPPRSKDDIYAEMP